MVSSAIFLIVLLNVVMLGVVMFNVIVLSVFLLNDPAPTKVVILEVRKTYDIKLKRVFSTLKYYLKI